MTPAFENSDTDEIEGSFVEDSEYFPGEIGEIQRKDNSHWQFDKLAPIWGIFILLIVQAILKDGNFVGVETCSTEFWLIYIVYAFLCLSAVVYSAIVLKRVSIYELFLMR